MYVYPVFTHAPQGVHSRKGKGAMFWVELVYALATPEEVETARAASALAAPGDVSPEPSVIKSGGGKTVSFNSSESDFSRPILQGGVPGAPPTPASLPSVTPLHERHGWPAASLGLPAIAGVAEAVKSPAPATGAPTRAPPAAAAAPADAPLSVLVVDDDPMTRTLMSRCARSYARAAGR
jgi:hypothetical protein